MARVALQATGIEFDEGGTTVWVHGPHGTILRIKCRKVRSHACSAYDPHADVQVDGDIVFCIPGLENETQEEATDVHED